MLGFTHARHKPGSGKRHPDGTLANAFRHPLESVLGQHCVVRLIDAAQAIAGVALGHTRQLAEGRGKERGWRQRQHHLWLRIRGLRKRKAT